MALPTLETVAAAWAIASGVGITGLGLVSLTGGRSRPWGALPLALFAVTWGLQIVAGNLTRIVSDVALATDLLLFSAAALLPLPFFLIEFASQQTGPGVGSPRWRLARLATGTFTVVGAALFALRPELFLQDVQTQGGVLAASWGPMMTVAQIAFFASLGVTLVALLQGLDGAPTPRISRRALILFAGLGLYASYAAGFHLTFYAAWVSQWGSVGRNVTFLAAFLALTGLIVWVLAQVLSRVRSATRSDERWRYRIALGAVAIPLVWGVTEGYLVYTYAPRLDTVGLWRLLAVGVVTYGLARWRIFDLPQRAQRVAASTTGATGAVTGGATAFGAASLVTTTVALPLAAGAVVTTLGLAPAVRYARRLFGVEDTDAEAPDADGPRRYGQRIDAYRAALEASMARGTLEEDEAFLESLRRRFGLGEEADQVLRHLAREAVVMPNERPIEGAYERLRLLGEGGSGRSWLARDRRRDRLVVLKEPVASFDQDPELESRVLEEARAAARFDHPNIVRVHEVVRAGDVPVIVMEYVDGGSLEDVLRSDGVLAWQRAVRLALDVLAGVAALHEEGILHRDVKPANVLLTAEGTAKLADFGIARQTDRGDTLVDADDGLSGTPAYMAPEVAAGKPHSQTSDLYSCGALLYEMLHGSPPGQGRTVLAENDVPEPLKAVLAKATARDPDARFDTASAFARALSEVHPDG